MVIVILLVIFLIGKCSSGPKDVPANTAEAAVSQPAYVAARSLNCRRGPEGSAAIAEGLSRDDRVVVAERRGDWARLTRVPGDCWVSGSFLADTPSSGRASTVAGSYPSRAHGLVSSGIGPSVAAVGAGYRAGQVARSRRSHTTSKRNKLRSRRGSGSGYQGSGCPCSGSQVCIGPRGGRYCITSGGNKRYGV